MNSKNHYLKGIRVYYLNKIATTILYILITIWLYILFSTSTATGYEISIYSAYTPFFWFLYILIIILGICLTMYFIIASEAFWKHCFLAIIIMDIVILFLPTIRNYEFYALTISDLFDHLGWSKFILNTGYIADVDIYPAMHILVATLSHLSSLEPDILAVIISVFFFISYVLSLFILGKTILRNNKSAAIFSVFGSPLLFSFGHHAFFPFLFALLLFPLIIYTICKTETYNNKTKEYYLCLIVILMFIVFCHPMVTFILLLTLVCLYGYAQVSSKYKLGFSCKINLLRIAVIVGISFIIWYINFQTILRMGKSITMAILGESGQETILTNNIDIVSQSNAPLARIIEAFIKVYGPLTIYLVLALIITIFLIYDYLTERKSKDKLVYAALFLLSLTYGAAVTVGYFIIFELIRATSFMIIMATIMCAIGFDTLFKNLETLRWKKTITMITVVVLCLVSILSVFNVYSSPWNFSMGKHLTKMESNGLNWFFINHDESTPVYLIDNRTRDKYFRYFQETHNNLVHQPRAMLISVPYHFGYHQLRYLSQTVENFKDDRFYLITDERLRQRVLMFPEEMRSSKEYFSKNNFSRLEGDSTIIKIYINGEWELWKSSAYCP